MIVQKGPVLLERPPAPAARGGSTALSSSRLPLCRSAHRVLSKRIDRATSAQETKLFEQSKASRHRAPAAIPHVSASASLAPATALCGFYIPGMVCPPGSGLGCLKSKLTEWGLHEVDSQLLTLHPTVAAFRSDLRAPTQKCRVNAAVTALFTKLALVPSPAEKTKCLGCS